jgi:branched-chain amino acid transport system permease protein
MVTLSAYLVSWGSSIQGWPLPLAVGLAILAGVVGGVLCVALVYRFLDRHGGSAGLFGVFIASLGIVLAGTAAILLIWSGQPTYSYELVPLHVWLVGEVPISLLQVTVFVTGIVLALAVDALFQRTSLGRQLRAVEADRALAATMGLRVTTLFLVVFAIGSFLFSVVGVLRAAQYAATSSTGADVALYALLVALLSQGRRPAWYLGVGVVVGLVQSAFGQLFGQTWQETAVFVALFLLIAAMPYRPAAARSLRRLTSATPVTRPAAK